jgi:amino acid adenylation domain-containing protein
MQTSSTSKRDRQDILPTFAESNESLPACFERVAVTHHRRTALVSDGRQWTYAELNAVANHLAHTFVSHGGAPGDRIAILMQHDAPSVAAAVAVLKASRIVVALNPTHPLLRLRELIEDSEPFLIVTDASLRNVAQEIAGLRCAVVDFEEHSAQGPDHNLSIVVPPEQVAKLVYTSGSTGRPKGVMVTHRQIRRNVFLMTEAMEFSAGDRIPLFSSLSAGQGMIITWCALLNGMALCPFPVIDKGVTGLADWMTRRGITVYGSSASIYRNFMKTLDPDFRFSGIRAVRLSSEPATSDDFKQFQMHFPQNCWFVHTLTSTETSNIAWSRRLRGDMVPEGRLPIGAVVSKGQEVLILDEDDRPVTAGAVGEIAVRSRYVAAGYWRNPELTAKHFSGDLDDTGTRLVRTGDLGRINAAGMLEFCGRRDDRVKIRGNSIELSEIAEALHRLKGIERAVIEAVPRAGGENLLVGFITVRCDQSWTQPELRRALRVMLPDSMVPSEFVILQNFPLTPSGKIDREKLRQDFHLRRQPQFGERPNTETESLLAGIWSEVFERSDIGQHDDFFTLGGDSLMATVIAAQVYDAVKVELNLATFSDFPTLAELADVIDRLRVGGEDDASPVVPVPRNEPLPMSFSQERIWKFSQSPAASAAYTMPRIFRIVGPLDVGVLRDCMDDLVRRHEILRTTFARQGRSPVSIIHPSAPTPLQYFDLSGMADLEVQAEVIFKKEAAFEFDLRTGPLLRFTLVRLRDDEYRLLWVSHHIISDNASLSVYFRELAMLYEAKLRGGASPLPKLAALQYGDYAVWQRRVLHPEGSTYRQVVSWWKDNLSGAPRMLRLPFTRVDAKVKGSTYGRVVSWWEDHISPSALRLPFARIIAKTAVAPADGMIFWSMERQVSHRLNALGSACKATRPAVRLAAFAALLAAETDQADVIVGLYVTGRNRLPLLSMIGDFSNLVTLRFQSDSTKSFIEWLSIVRDQIQDAEGYSAVPYENLCEEFKRGGVGLPEIKVIFHISRLGRLIEFAGLKLIWMDRPHQRIPWGFTIDFDEQNEEDKCSVLFDPRIYDPAGVRVFVQHYERLLDAVSRHPDKTLGDLLAISCADSITSVGTMPTVAL